MRDHERAPSWLQLEVKQRRSPPWNSPQGITLLQAAMQGWLDDAWRAANGISAPAFSEESAAAASPPPHQPSEPGTSAGGGAPGAEISAAEATAVRRLWMETVLPAEHRPVPRLPAELRSLAGATRLVVALDRIVHPGVEPGCVSVLFRVQAAPPPLAALLAGGSWAFWRWPRQSLQPGKHAEGILQRLLRTQQLQPSERQPPLEPPLEDSPPTAPLPEAREAGPARQEAGEEEGGAALSLRVDHTPSRSNLLRFYRSEQAQSSSELQRDGGEGEAAGEATAPSHPSDAPVPMLALPPPGEEIAAPAESGSLSIRAEEGGGAPKAAAGEASPAPLPPADALLRDVASVASAAKAAWDWYALTAVLDVAAFLFAALSYQAVVTSSRGLTNMAAVKVRCWLCSLVFTMIKVFAASVASYADVVTLQEGGRDGIQHRKCHGALFIDALAGPLLVCRCYPPTTWQ